MKKILFPILAVICLTTFLAGQEINPDSLRAVADSLHAVGDSLLFWTQIEFEELQAKDIIVETGKDFTTTRYSEAIAAFEREHELRILLADTLGLCRALSGASEGYRAIKDYDQGLKVAQRALDLGIETFGEDDTTVAMSYHIIGFIYFSSNDFDRALENLEKALEIRLKRLGPGNLEVALSYMTIGETYRKFEQMEKGLEYFEDALEIFNNQPHTFSNVRFIQYLGLYMCIGDSYRGLGDYESAIENYQRRLELARETYGEECKQVGDSYVHLGLCYWRLGEYQDALDYFSEAREIWLELFGVEWHGIYAVDNYFANLHSRLGDYNSSLKLHKEALISSKAVKGDNHPKTGQMYANLAVDYLVLDSLDKAKEYARKALDIWTEVLKEGEPFDEADYSIYVSMIADSEPDSVVEKELRKAIQLTSEAIPYCWVERYGTNHSIVAKHYSDLGDLYFYLEEYKIAQGNYEISQGIWERSRGKYHPYVGYYYVEIGTTFEERGKYKKALRNYRTGLDLLIKSLGPNHMSVASCYFYIADVYRSMGKKDSALHYYDKAIAIFEETRARLSTSLQTTYTERLAVLYESIISLLVEMNRPSEAFEYLERSKLKFLKDALEEKYNIEFGKGEFKVRLMESKRMAMYIEDLEGELLRARLRDDTSQVEELSEQLAEVKAEYARLTAEIESDPDYAFAVKVEPINFEDIRKKLPPGQMLLMSYSAQKELYLFLLSHEGYQVRALPMSRDSLNYLIQGCRKLCGIKKMKRLYEEGKTIGWSWRDDGSEFYKEEVKPLRDVLHQLYLSLVAPFDMELISAEIVTFIPSGNLNYVPWGALMDIEGDSVVFLTERYNWNVLTSTELLRCTQRRESWQPDSHLCTTVLVGNPTGAGLQSAETEVKAIGKLYSNTHSFIGEDATEPKIVASVPEACVLHIATHCKLNASNPWENFIYLVGTDSTDGRWTAAEISSQTWEYIQLVTLSACQTGLGSNRPGLESESIAKAFSLAMEGPPSIVATLWSVADESTMEFMVTFYEELKHSPKSEALRKAQQKLIHSEEYAHPFFWAPFILIGEWR